MLRFDINFIYSNKNSDELDTDTEFEPVEDMTHETRSRCKNNSHFIT